MTIYIIEKAWGDPLENRNDFGYSDVGYVKTLEEAERIVANSEEVPNDFTWSIRYMRQNGMVLKMLRFRALEEYQATEPNE